MTRNQRINRNLNLAKYLCSVIGKDKWGENLYPTLNEAGTKFGLHPNHVSRLKKELTDRGILVEDSEGRRLNALSNA